MIHAGRVYTDRGGRKWDCIYTEGDLAWMRTGSAHSAYVFYRDGQAKCLSLDPTYDVDWNVPWEPKY